MAIEYGPSGGRELKRGVLGWLLCAICLFTTSCEDDSFGDPSFRWFERFYDGHLYRQYYRKGEEQFGRLYTFVVRPDGRWTRVGDINLADQVQARGMTIDTGIKTGFPGLQGYFALRTPERTAAQTLQRRVFILDVNAQERVIAVDAVAGSVVGKVELGQTGPVGIVKSPDGRRLYVVVRPQAAFGPSIPALPPALIILRTEPLGIERRINLPETLLPRLVGHPLEISPDGALLFFVNEGKFENGGFTGSTIVRLNATTGAVQAQIPNARAGMGYGSICLSPDGAVLYALSSGRLALIDTLTNTLSTEVNMLSQDSIAVHPSGAWVYAPRAVPPGIHVFDAVAGVLSTGIELPASRERTNLHVTPDGKNLFVNDDAGGAIWVIDPRRRQIVQRIEESQAGAVIGMER